MFRVKITPGDTTRPFLFLAVVPFVLSLFFLFFCLLSTSYLHKLTSKKIARLLLVKNLEKDERVKLCRNASTFID